MPANTGRTVHCGIFTHLLPNPTDTFQFLWHSVSFHSKISYSLADYVLIVGHPFFFFFFGNSIISWLSPLYSRHPYQSLMLVPPIHEFHYLSSLRQLNGAGINFTSLEMMTLKMLLLLFSHPVMSDSLGCRGLQHTWHLCTSASPEVCPGSCPLHQ